MTQSARVTCPRCGANNFDTSHACWKCGAPLVSPVGTATESRRVYRETFRSSEQMGPRSTVEGDPGVARRAAIGLALVVPWIGLPVGWIFMMIEDGRRQAVGRVCVVWSIAALILHLLLMVVAAQAAGAMLSRQLLPLIESMARSAGQASRATNPSAGPSGPE